MLMSSFFLSAMEHSWSALLASSRRDPCDVSVYSWTVVAGVELPAGWQLWVQLFVSIPR